MSQVIVITGASGGIGRATAVAFAHRGAKLALLARGEAGLAAAKKDAETAGAAQVITLRTDIADFEQVEAAAAQAEQALGPIDVWVNNAMATIFSPLQEITPAEFKRATEVTYLGSVWGTMAALKRMRPRNRGTIVQVGSALAYRGIPLQAPYCGAKFAVRGFLDSLRSELIHEGSKVHVTMVQLCAFNTPQFVWGRTHMKQAPQPLPPIFDPHMAASAIVWAATHRRRELWVGFPTVKTILGARLIPGLLDHYLAKKAWAGQLTDNDTAAGRPDNLFNPAAGDFGIHGPFTDRARSNSWQLRLAEHRAAVIAVAAVAVMLVALPMVW